MSNYSYPIDLEWSHEEMTKVVVFLNQVELAYETGVDVENLLIAYKGFKEVVRSIGEEKRIGAEFEKVSSYSIYRTITAAKKTNQKRLRMEL